jgi:DNA-binding HxlR family transcriptional regulator
VLWRNLKELETNGVVNRKVYAEVSPKAEYTLTEKGGITQRCDAAIGAMG